MNNDLLIEIGTEELPAKGLLRVAEAFASVIIGQLDMEQFTHGKHHFYVTPRRLAIVVEQVSSMQPVQKVERKGPALSAAFDAEGKPTKAAEGFARSCGVSFDELSKEGNHLFYCSEKTGEPLDNRIYWIIYNALSNIFARTMKWGAHQHAFIRPMQWICLLHGDRTIELEIFDIRTSNATRSHRFMGAKTLTITHPSEYASLLFTEGHVIADFAERRKAILQEATKLAEAYQAQLCLDDGLLDEITGLVEWPMALVASFDERFLQVPHEALISSMQGHQKSIPLINKQGSLFPNFMLISNIESRDPSQVIKGNERVMHARLSDAEFFYQTDSQHRLDSRLEKLKQVSFQAKLGSLYDKSERVAHLSTLLEEAGCFLVDSEDRPAQGCAGRSHEQFRLMNQQGNNPPLAQRAAWLSKTDLTTEMVGEFPELQGIMGYHYAIQDGESKEVAIALKEQYLPRFSGDILPETKLGQVLAIADRLDTIVGIFGINQQPTGDKDPFGLRRAAQGILRILIEKEWDLDLTKLLQTAIELYGEKIKNKNLFDEIIQFLLDRLRASYQEKGINPSVFLAVAKRVTTHPLDFHNRIQAVQKFLQLPQAEALIAANKRVSNLLEKNPVDDAMPDKALLQHETEKVLFKQITDKLEEVEKLYQDKKYTEILITLADLQAPVDQFFTDVMVMVDDEAIQLNRLRMLSQLKNLFLKVADISDINV